MQRITKAQRKALHSVYRRILKHDRPEFGCWESGKVRKIAGIPSYRQWRKLFYFDSRCEYIMVPFGSMFLGIEQDGYTHS